MKVKHAKDRHIKYAEHIFDFDSIIEQIETFMDNHQNLYPHLSSIRLYKKSGDDIHGILCDEMINENTHNKIVVKYKINGYIIKESLKKETIISWEKFNE